MRPVQCHLEAVAHGAQGMRGDVRAPAWELQLPGSELAQDMHLRTCMIMQGGAHGMHGTCPTVRSRTALAKNWQCRRNTALVLRLSKDVILTIPLL